MALPLEVIIFHYILARQEESPNALAVLGLFLTLVGLALYLWAAPEEFSTTTSADGRRLSFEHSTSPFSSDEEDIHHDEDEDIQGVVLTERTALKSTPSNG